MPSKDRTFSDKDMVRITLRYLTRLERLKVLEFFGLGLDLPPPKEGPTPEKKKIDTAKIELDIAIKTLGIVGELLDVAEKFPGPQRGALTAINKSLGVLLTVLQKIATILG